MVLFSWSCVPDQMAIINTADSFYDINGLIDEQIKMLDSISPSIVKKATIGAEEEMTKEDPTTWSKEMNIFRSADINKPLLRDSYEVSNISAGNFETILYKSKRPDGTIVDELSIELIQGSQKPVKVIARLNSKNPLFNSVKTLEMYFQNIDGKQMLSKYKSQGWQKMISKDSTYYTIEAELVYY